MIQKRVKGDISLVDKFIYICCREALKERNIENAYKDRSLNDLLGFTIVGNVYKKDTDGHIVVDKQIDTLLEHFASCGCDIIKDPERIERSQYVGVHLHLRYMNHRIEGQAVTWEDFEHNKSTHELYKRQLNELETLTAEHGLTVVPLREMASRILDLRHQS